VLNNAFPAITPGDNNRLRNIQTLVKDYQNVLSYYITARANSERIDRIKLEAASIGNKLLNETEEMSIQASTKLSIMTDAAMGKIKHVKTVLHITHYIHFIVGLIIAARLTIFITRPTEALVQAPAALQKGISGIPYSYKDKTSSESWPMPSMP